MFHVQLFIRFYHYPSAKRGVLSSLTTAHCRGVAPFLQRLWFQEPLSCVFLCYLHSRMHTVDQDCRVARIKKVLLRDKQQQGNFRLLEVYRLINIIHVLQLHIWQVLLHFICGKVRDRTRFCLPEVLATNIYLFSCFT